MREREREREREEEEEEEELEIIKKRWEIFLFFYHLATIIFYLGLITTYLPMV